MRWAVVALVALVGCAPHPTTWCANVDGVSHEFDAGRVTISNRGTKADRRTYVLAWDGRTHGHDARVVAYADSLVIVQPGRCPEVR